MANTGVDTEIGTLACCWWDCKAVQPLWKNSMLVPQKIKITVWCNNSTSGYLLELKAESWRDSGMPVFTALFTIARRWSRPNCALVDEWINNVCGSMQYYWALRKENLSYATTVMNLEDITLGESSREDLHEWFHFHEVPGVVRVTDTGERWVLGTVETWYLKGTVLTLQDEKSSRGRMDLWWLCNNMSVLNTSELYTNCD